MFNCLRLIPMRGESIYHAAWVCNYQTLYSYEFTLSILWTIYNLSFLGSMWHMRIVVVYEVVVTGNFGLKKVHLKKLIKFSRFMTYLLLKVIEYCQCQQISSIFKCKFLSLKCLVTPIFYTTDVQFLPPSTNL